MMFGKEDLGLSLTLGSSSHHQWSSHLLSSSSERIDVNRPLPGGDRESEEEGGASSPNSTLERASSRGVSDEEDADGSRKKLRLSKDQSAILEESFKEHNTLNPKQKVALAKQLNLRPRQVEVWFQNRRARTKLKQTEVDCEFLKRCCENLTEENQRLQKEVLELRTLKLSPQFYMHMTPPTTLTMCPSCERVVPAASQPSIDHQFIKQPHPKPLAIAAPPPTPWAPVPLRASFLDINPQRSVRQ